MQYNLLFYIMIGACIGSFINVLIYRLPIMLANALPKPELQGNEKEIYSSRPRINLFYPRSFCPNCKKIVPARYNIPIISWIILRGISHCCNKKISTRYVFIELLAVIQTLAVLLVFKEDLLIFTSLILIWTLTALTFIDLDSYLLPDTITLPLLWVGLLVNINSTFASLSSAVLGAVIGYLFLWLSYWLFKLVKGIDGMGYGDFKLMAALGAWFGVNAIPFLIFTSSIFGILVYATFYFFSKKRVTHIAFGPYISLAGVIYLFFGESITLLFFL